jgi:hypothetical protein
VAVILEEFGRSGYRNWLLKAAQSRDRRADPHHVPEEHARALSEEDRPWLAENMPQQQRGKWSSRTWLVRLCIDLKKMEFLALRLLIRPSQQQRKPAPQP